MTQIKNWIKLLAITGTGQILIQVLGLCGGVLLIRIMPIKEYAWYTIANTMLGALTIFSDGGITTGVLAEGGKVWNNKKELGIVLVTGMELRNKFALFSIIVSTPVLIYFLKHNEASWIISITISISLIPAFYASLSDSILEVPLKLHQNISSLQKNQITVSINRLALIGFIYFIYPLTAFALLANGLPRLFGNIKLKKLNHDFVDLTQKPDKIVQKNILELVKRLMPEGIYTCVSGQITIWLISFFGNTTSVAQLGGLLRLYIALGFFSVMGNMLFVPRFAKIIDNKKLLIKRFVQINLFFIFLSFFILFFVWLFNKQILLILGVEYKSLKFELLLIMVWGCINLLATLISSLYTSKGWAIKPIISIPINIFSIILGIVLFKASTLTGILYMSIFVSLVKYLSNIFFSVIKIKKL